MTVYNYDVVRVEATAANIPTTLINGQAGFETDNSRWAFKDSGGSMHYFESLSGTSITDISITDNVANAFRVREGSNNYIQINTTDSSEHFYFGNTTTNPDYTFYGSGTTTVEGAWICEDDVEVQGKMGIGAAAGTELLTLTENAPEIHLVSTNASGVTWSLHSTSLGEFRIYEETTGYLAMSFDKINGQCLFIGNVVHSQDIFLPDDKKIQFGNALNSQRAAIYWDTTETPDCLKIINNVGGAGAGIILETPDGSSQIEMKPGGSTTVTFDDTSTTMIGTVTLDGGTISASGSSMLLDSTANIQLDASQLYFQVSSNNVIICNGTYITLYDDVIIDSGTADRFVYLNGAKGFTYVAGTGTANVVRSASPTLTGTITAAAANFSGDVTVGGNFAVTGRYDAGDGGTGGAYEQIDVDGVDMIFVDPSGASTSYYYLTDGSYQGQRVSVTNNHASGVSATINMSGSPTGAGSGQVITGNSYQGIIFKWDVTNDRWFAFGNV